MFNSKSIIKYSIIIFIFLIQNSLEDQIVPCLVVQECKQLTNSKESILCSEHGKCFYDLYTYIIENNQSSNFLTCVCDDGYTNLHESKAGDGRQVKCCYEQKDQFTAFVLEITFGFGAGHLYVGNWTRFLCKCIIECCLILSVIIIEIFLWCKRAKDVNMLNTENANNNGQKKDFSTENPKIKIYEMVLRNLIILFFAIIIIWQFIDSILFGINYYTDTNDMTLKQW